MGMASFTSNLEQVKQEFTTLKGALDELNKIVFSDTFKNQSMGITGDYTLTIELGQHNG